MDYQTLGTEVAVRRKARGWSRRELARRAGISDTTLKYMEAGARPDGMDYNPSQATLAGVADAFGGDDAVDILRMYGRDDMARFVESTMTRRNLRAVRDPDPEPELTAAQERAIQRIVEELTRLVATANLSSHKGLSRSSGNISQLRSSPAA